MDARAGSLWNKTAGEAIPRNISGPVCSEEPHLVPSRPKNSNKTTDFVFNYSKDFSMTVTEEFRRFCGEKSISVSVFGHKSKGFFSLREALQDRRRAQTVAERYSIAHPDLCWVCFNINLKCDHKLTRWSDLVQSVQLWVEVQEINDYGQYSPVTVLPREDVEVGGVVQLKQVLHYRPHRSISSHVTSHVRDNREELW